MKLYRRTGQALLTFLLAAGFQIPAVSAEPDTPEPFHLLVFGSSAWHGVIDDLPGIARADGIKVDVRCLRGNITAFAAAVSADPDSPAAFCALETDYQKKVRVTDEIAAQKWDAIIMHPHSTALDAEAYLEDAKKLYACLKEKHPDALIVMNENQSDRGDGIRNRGSKGARGNAPIKPAKHRPKEFLYDMDTLYEDQHKAAKSVADELGIGIGPVGTAFHLAKTHPLWGYRFPDPEFDYDNARPPALPKNTRSLWVGARWSKDKKTGEDFFMVDHHKNNAGRYLQAAVYYEVLFGRSVTGNAYRPDSAIVRKGSDVDYAANIPLGPDEIKALQQIAHEAVAKFYPGKVTAGGKP